MEKKAQLYEIIIKFIFALFSFIAAIFVVKNIISMFPLISCLNKSELELYQLIFDTHIGNILHSMGIIVDIDFNTILNGFVSFLINIEWISIIFLIMTLIMLLLHFVFIKWSLLRVYLKLSGISILLYILKHLLFVIVFALFYKGGSHSMSIAFIIGSIIYIIVSLVQIFIFSLWIIKFIFNIVGDVKYYYTH